MTAYTYSDLSARDKRSLLILLMEDIRGSFDLGAGDRSHMVLELAHDLGYPAVEACVRECIADDDYRDGRHFRIAFECGGYEDPPFPVTRLRSKASPALRGAVDALCDFPEYRLVDGQDGMS